MSEKSTNDESHEEQDEPSKDNNEVNDNQQSITMVEIAQWYEFLDTSSNKYYYHNYATGETSWEKPISTSSSKIIQIVPYHQVSQSDSATYGQSSDSLSNTYAALSSTVTSVLPQSLLTTPGQGDYTATAYFNQSSGRFGGTGNNYWEEVSFFYLFLFLISLLLPHFSLFMSCHFTRKEFQQIVQHVKCHDFSV
jgi:hypothetical protein